MDGTLVDSFQLIIESFNYAGGRFLRRRLSREEGLSIPGGTLEDQLANYVPLSAGQQSCGGGGGALSIRPAGVLEITEGETRFIPIGVGRKLAGALLVGLILGVLIAGKRSKDK
jgi:hypothetical protein